jgi:hypothetical protein
LARFDELEPEHRDKLVQGVTEHLHQECRNLLHGIYDGLIARLRKAELVAYALDANGRIEQGRIRIPAAWWNQLDIDPEFEDVRGPNGIHLTDVLIFEADPARIATRPARAQSKTPSAPPKPRNVELELRNNGGLLRAGDEVLVFRGDARREVVSKLALAYTRGDRLLTKTLLEKTRSDTLAKFFKGGRSAEKLMRMLRQENGYCWLEPSGLGTRK